MIYTYWVLNLYHLNSTSLKLCQHYTVKWGCHTKAGSQLQEPSIVEWGSQLLDFSCHWLWLLKYHSFCSLGILTPCGALLFFFCQEYPDRDISPGFTMFLCSTGITPFLPCILTETKTQRHLASHICKFALRNWSVIACFWSDIYLSLTSFT